MNFHGVLIRHLPVLVGAPCGYVLAHGDDGGDVLPCVGSSSA